MSRRTFKLSFREEDDESPASNFALTLTFAFLGLTNTFLNLIPGGIRGLLSF